VRDSKKDKQSCLAVVFLVRNGFAKQTLAQFKTLISLVRATNLYLSVEVASVEQGGPSLPEALQCCVEAGAKRILILPLFILGYERLSPWLRKVILRWRAGCKRGNIAVLLADPLEMSPMLGNVVIGALIDAADSCEDVACNAPEDWEQDPDDWSIIPPHRYHIFTCQGPRCTARGAGALWSYLSELLERYDLCETPGGVLVTRCGCQYPCNLGPVMTVYPDGVWYCRLDRQAIGRIVREHFLDGKIVEAFARYPG